MYFYRLESYKHGLHTYQVNSTKDNYSILCSCMIKYILDTSKITFS